MEMEWAVKGEMGASENRHASGLFPTYDQHTAWPE